MINARLDAKDLINDFENIQREFPKATSLAINEIAKQTKTFISKDIRETYYIKLQDLNKLFTITKANPLNLSAILTTFGKGISFTRFGTKFPTKQSKGPSGKKRYLVKTKIKKGSSPIVARNIFSIPGKKTFFREKYGKVEKAYSVGPGTMFNDKVKNKAIQHSQLIFPRILEQKINYLFK